MSPDESLSPSRQLFADYLEQRERAGEEAESFDVFAARHPEHAAALARLNEEYELLRLLGGGGGPGAAAGDGGEGDPATDPTWSDFLASIRATEDDVRYTERTEIARGGMGVVYSVYDRRLRRHLAMKVTRSDDDPSTGRTELDDASLGRFLEEAQVTAQLDHPGVVPVHELGVDESGRVFFTMRLVKGDDLRRVFEKVDAEEDGWSVTRAVHVVLRACEAIAFAHARGVLHRDLKPSNIMVGRFGETYVMDWGLARIVDRELRRDPPRRPARDSDPTQIGSERRERSARFLGGSLNTLVGEVIGTPVYMAPEQARGEHDQLGPRTDVYGMGAILYELLTARLPYVEPNEKVPPQVVLGRVREGGLAPVSKVAPDVPVELAAVCEKAMAHDPEHRYPSMEGLAEDLRAYLEGRVVKAHARGPIVELKKWVARNRAVAMTAAVALVVVSGLGFFLALQQKNAKEAVALERDLADAERERVLRLSDKKRIEDLVAEMDDIWPAIPEQVPAMRDWIRRADLLLARLDEHEETLRAIEEHGTHGPHRLDAELVKYVDHKAKDLSSDHDHEFESEAERTEHIALLDVYIHQISDFISRERAWDFGADTEARWWHEAQLSLVVGLRELVRDSNPTRTVAGMRERMKFAEGIDARTIDGEEDAWAEAIASIADTEVCPAYDGLVIAPQRGLVPLGRDEESGLWEFWHVQSGAVAERDERDRLVCGPETGMVMVLVPSGSLLMGAQSVDPDGLRYDEDASSAESTDGVLPTIELAPFFIGKWEVTQGQWQRITGATPSFYKADKSFAGKLVTLAHPVEAVTWIQCEEVLVRWDLLLPTEAQWEYACRAGTESRYWTGDAPESLEGAVNMADLTALRHETIPPSGQAPLFDDGFAVHAPVGRFEPNPFGLHDVLGNVYEWCRDSFVKYEHEMRPGDGFRTFENFKASVKVIRGGGHSGGPRELKASARARNSPDRGISTVGVRVSRELRPAIRR